MAATAARKVAGFPWRPLARALTTVERARIAGELAALVRWQRTLADWPKPRAAPDAVPFVSIYARGRLVGCRGSDEGAPADRLRRAFLGALGDSRFEAIAPAERVGLASQVSYLRDVRRIDGARAAAELEPGSDGVALIPVGGAPALLLPDVARDQGLDADGLLRALLQKARAGAAELKLGELFAFRTERITARSDGPEPPGDAGALDLACAWLSKLVHDDGRIDFAVDARSGARQELGPMHHGRVSVLVRALAEHGGFASEVRRARERLRRDCTAGLRGARVAGWPEEPATIAGTLALAVLAGVPVGAELRAFAATSPGLAGSTWHAAQVVTALGSDAPEPLWRACVDDLARRPIAPWTALAAEARRERALAARLHRAIGDSLRRRAPHAGGADGPRVPELALTALAIEALLSARSAGAAAARTRGREFLRRWQLLPGRIPAALDPGLAAGAFPASPVMDGLRADITAHAVLALRDT